MNDLPVIVGFALGSALGAAGDAAWGLRSVSVPTALALGTSTAPPVGRYQ